MPQIGFQNVDFFEKMVANNLVAGQLRGPIFCGVDITSFYNFVFFNLLMHFKINYKPNLT